MSMKLHADRFIRSLKPFTMISSAMFLLTFLTYFTPSSCFAGDTDIELRAPCQTGIPSPLRKPKDIIPLGCDRPFLYRGEVYSTDPPQIQDASTLKYFVQTVPEANSILDDYQSVRNKSKISAYTGTFGVVMFLFSNTIAKQFSAANQDSVRGALRVGGLSIATGGFFYSFMLLRSNEKLIPQAVDAYNKVKPNDPVELQFSTGWSF